MVTIPDYMQAIFKAWGEAKTFLATPEMIDEFSKDPDFFPLNNYAWLKNMPEPLFNEMGYHCELDRRIVLKMKI